MATYSLEKLRLARDNASSGAVNLSPNSAAANLDQYMVSEISCEPDHYAEPGQNITVTWALSGGSRVAELQSSARQNFSVTFDVPDNVYVNSISNYGCTISQIDPAEEQVVMSIYFNDGGFNDVKSTASWLTWQNM